MNTTFQQFIDNNSSTDGFGLKNLIKTTVTDKKSNIDTQICNTFVKNCAAPDKMLLYKQYLTNVINYIDTRQHKLQFVSGNFPISIIAFFTIKHMQNVLDWYQTKRATLPDSDQFEILVFIRTCVISFIKSVQNNDDPIMPVNGNRELFQQKWLEEVKKIDIKNLLDVLSVIPEEGIIYDIIQLLLDPTNTKNIFINDIYKKNDGHQPIQKDDAKPSKLIWLYIAIICLFISIGVAGVYKLRNKVR